MPPSCGKHQQACKCGASCTLVTKKRGTCQKNGQCSASTVPPNCGTRIMRTPTPAPARARNFGSIPKVGPAAPSRAPTRALLIPFPHPESSPTTAPLCQSCGQGCGDSGNGVCNQDLACEPAGTSVTCSSGPGPVCQWCGQDCGDNGVCNEYYACEPKCPTPVYCPPQGPTPGAPCAICGSYCVQSNGEDGSCNWENQCVPVLYDAWCPPTPAPTVYCPPLKCTHPVCVLPSSLQFPTSLNGCPGCGICQRDVCPPGECLPCCPMANTNDPLPCRKCSPG